GEAAAEHPAQAIMGHEIEYTAEPAGKPKRVIVGKVVAWEPDSARIVDSKKGIQWPSFRLKIKPSDGSRALWTVALPNHNEPMPWPARPA
nr:hypothetical protein [Tanacetum cinerariifolium]